MATGRGQSCARRWSPKRKAKCQSFRSNQPVASPAGRLALGFVRSSGLARTGLGPVADSPSLDLAIRCSTIT